MDPISASIYNLNCAGKEDEQKDEFARKVGSCKSLSQYENRSFKNILPQIFAGIIATSSHLVVGICLSYSAVLIPQLQAKDSDITVTEAETSWIASVMVLVAPVGQLASGWLMDRFGRVNTLKLATIPGVLGWILLAVSWNVPIIITARLILGFASSLATSPAIVYITEIARPDMRGSLLSLGPAFVSLGMVISYLQGWLLHWRTLAWICNVYTILPLIFLFFLPESPQWLIMNNRKEDAKKSLNWIYRYQPQPDDRDESFAELQLELLANEQKKKEAEVKARDSNESKYRGFLKPTGYKPMIILTGLFFFQQFSGIYIFMFYSVSFFEAAGTSMNPYVASVMIGLVRLVMSLVNTWMLKNFTRRVLVVVSASGMAFCTFISGLFTYWIKQDATNMTWIPVVFLLLYVVFSMVGLLSIPWTMTAELFPIEIRSMAHSISSSIVNLMMFAAVQNYANFMWLFGGSAGVQWFFCGISLGAVVYCIIFLPETHGKKLSDIEEYFKHNLIYLGQKTAGEDAKSDSKMFSKYTDKLLSR